MGINLNWRKALSILAKRRVFVNPNPPSIAPFWEQALKSIGFSYTGVFP
jgi:hypothetical protein